jgi:hypothetical protein
MPLTPDEKRARQRRYARESRERARLAASERLTRDFAPDRETSADHDARPPLTIAPERTPGEVEAGTLEALGLFADEPATAHLRASAIAIARAMDDPTRIAQLAALSARLDATVSKIASTSKTTAVNELDELRRAFYTGTVVKKPRGA